MSVHEAIDRYKEAPPEEKLDTLRTELQSRARLIKGYGEQLKQQYYSQQTSNPTVIVDWIIETADEMNKLLDALHESGE
ncbi:MAG: hypothetical protein D6737_17890 [Chloroflexi bacterium]|nr:MAG: hypothetical protein D6737_17890 [Chloroflexota bacterium]